MKKTSPTKFLLVLTISVLALLPQLALAQVPSTNDAIGLAGYNAMRKAITDNNATGLKSLLTDKATWYIAPPGEFTFINPSNTTGADATVAGLLNFEKSVKLTYGDPAHSRLPNRERRVTVKGAMESDTLKKAGLDKVEFTQSTDFEGPKIARITVVLPPATSDRLRDAGLFKIVTDPNRPVIDPTVAAGQPVPINATLPATGQGGATTTTSDNTGLNVALGLSAALAISAIALYVIRQRKV